jgi:tRNA threonylcarbamoyladenosine biosynthesis protein TsaB
LNVLAIDTSDGRGSVCLLEGTEVVASRLHDTYADYSEWLLPAVDAVFRVAGVQMPAVDLLAVSTGPGSFTGLRVGLTTVKAWAEVYGKRVIGVSRLEAIASPQSSQEGFVVVFYNAQRGQVFGALYHLCCGQLVRLEDEMVIPPEQFLPWVSDHAAQQSVSWISLDPELITSLADWKTRLQRGDTMARCSAELAPAIGRLGAERAQTGSFTDPLELDANYVRRTDAEIFWKGR